MALTGAWLGSSYDKIVIAELVPDGYKFLHVPRKATTGGGVALLHKTGISVKKVTVCEIQIGQFKYLECDCVVQRVSFQLSVLYRPPPSKKNELKASTFFDKLSAFFERMNSVNTDILITGDLNLHLDVANDPSSVKFRSLLQAHGLCQLVQGPTHKKGHTLDVVITRDTSALVSKQICLCGGGATCIIG